QLGTELPQTLGGSLVIRCSRRLHRTFLHEILARDALYLRGGRQIDERLRTLCRAEGSELSDPDEQGIQPTIIVAKPCSDKAGVHRISRDACACETPCQFVGEEEVRQF